MEEASADAHGGTTPPSNEDWAQLAALEGPASLIVTNESFELVWVNRQAASMLGYQPDEMVGLSVVDLMHPEDLRLAAAASAASEHLAEAPFISRPGLFRLRHRDGHYVSSELMGAPPRQAFGQRVGISSAKPSHFGLTDFLRSMADDEPISETMTLLLQMLLDHAFASGTVIRFADDDGLHAVTDMPVLPAVLAGVSPEGGARDEADGGHTPWAAAAVPGKPFVFESLDELSEPLATAARQLGFDSCVSQSIADPAGFPAATVVRWTRASALTQISTVWIERNAVPLVGLLLDMRHRRLLLQHSAHHDLLTGLPNRPHFFERLQERALDDEVVAILFCDLDGFKQVNDTFGHAAGDEVLVQAAERISRAVRSGDVVARFGGDEFIVLCRRLSGMDHAVAVAERLIAEVTTPFRTPHGEVGLGMSIGIAIGEARADVSLVAAADSAMYAAKAAGRNQWTAARL